ncbi:MAG: peptide chain release factor N(5)-glutamine methyltransferase [Cocleimonas sp.]|nr:peptide chain release factor N(5)-glutamine methyltransferase [Cocleimonas sp.]
MTKISDSPALDAELLLAHCLNKNRSYLFTWPENTLDEAQASCFNSLLEKRLTDYPVAYLLGTKAFWTLDLIVTPDVLIPRPETELLVEVALDKIRNIKTPKILDLGTGTGAIALALSSERPDAQITACDYSSEALKIAKLNAKNHGLSEQVTFIESNWFSNIEGEFDLIVSNPPYIAENDPHLLQTIRHEPQQALVAKDTGMRDIDILIKDGDDYLKNESWIIIEHGHDQGAKTLESFNKKGFSNAETRLDISQNPRLSFAQVIY